MKLTIQQYLQSIFMKAKKVHQCDELDQQVLPQVYQILVLSEEFQAPVRRDASALLE